MLIGIHGPKGRGKDTAAAMLMKNRAYERFAFADPLKLACIAIFRFSSAQMDDPKLKEVVDPRWGFSPRHAMTILGTECVREHFGQDTWLKSLALRVKETLKENAERNIVITDVRYWNESAWVHDNGGAIIEIKPEGFPPIIDDQTHSSEDGLSPEFIDISVPNRYGRQDDFLKDFQEALDRIIRSRKLTTKPPETITPTADSLEVTELYDDDTGKALMNTKPFHASGRATADRVTKAPSNLNHRVPVLLDLLSDEVTNLLNRGGKVPPADEMFWQEFLNSLEHAKQKLS